MRCAKKIIKNCTCKIGHPTSEYPKELSVKHRVTNLLLAICNFGNGGIDFVYNF